MKIVYTLAFAALLFFCVIARVAPSGPGWEMGLIWMARALIVLLYVIAVNAVCTDPVLSKIEKVCCVIAVLVGSLFGMGLVGMYMSYQTKKRFTLNLSAESDVLEAP